MTMVMPSSLVFKVEISEPELIAPAKPTPYEYKNLSAIDDQKLYRGQIANLHIYRGIAGMEGRDPVKVIREAVAETLVYYYPFAGRLREGPDDNLMVECTGEGILFIEADADARLDQFGDALHPPFVGGDNLLDDVPGSGGILHCPLLLIQVTRFLCGGFIFALRLNHTMSDATGIGQFMTAVAEIAQGASVPSTHPVWKRELLNARDPLHVSCVHHAYDELHDQMHLDDKVHRVFFFTLEDIVALRRHLPPDFGRCSKFDILTACLWRSRTIALKLSPDKEVRLGFFVNGRDRFDPPLPVGYYGNVVGIPVALSTAGKSKAPLRYVVGLIQRVKAAVTNDFMKSTIHLLIQRGRGIPIITDVMTYYVDNLTQMGFKDLDFGWGKPIFGGPTGATVPGSFPLSSKNNEGADGIAVTMNLPGPAMQRFCAVIEKMLKLHPLNRYALNKL